MFDKYFVSPQEKRCAIITYEDGIYELCYELLNDLRLKILGNYKISRKCFSVVDLWPTS